jgi:predicted transcriptional regulator
MDRVLEEIEFLALSTNRVDVLTRLAEAPHTRQELGAATDASQPTLGRILRDFEDRNWIFRSNEGYEVTATGRLVANGIGELYGILETELKLRDLIEWLPTEELTFDLQALREATITVPTQTRPGAPVGRVIELVQNAERVRVLSHAFNDRTLQTVTDWVDGGGKFEAVFSANAIKPVTDDAVLADQLRRLVAADTATVRIYDGPVPLAVTLTDDIVSLLVRDDNGRLQASLDTDNPRVSQWAQELYGRYWNDAQPLDTQTLAELEF